jgi:hypothetical protein
LPAVANRQSVCAHRCCACPCRHPRRASRRSTCVPHGGIPRLRCTSADLGVRTFATGCFGTGCMPEKRQRETVRDANHRARFEEYSATHFANAEKKNPRRASEGVRVPRRSGRPISAKGRSVVVAVEAGLWPFRAGVRIAAVARRCGAAMETESGVHRKNPVESRGRGAAIAAVAAMGAHVTPGFSGMQTFFSHPRDAGRTNHAECGAAHKKQGDRSRPASHHALGEACRCYGRSTLSITWITPLL